MANVVRDPRTHPDAIIPDLATNNVAKFTVDQVAFVYGSLWKQRYFTKVGDDYFPLPVQWDVAQQDMASLHGSARAEIGGRAVYPAGQHAAAHRSPVRWLPFRRLQHQDQDRWRSGTSDVSAATDPAASTRRIPRAATFSIRRKWMAWPRTTPAFSVIPRDSL